MRKLIAPAARPISSGGVTAWRSPAVLTSKTITPIPPTNSDAATIEAETSRGWPGEASGRIASAIGNSTVAQRIARPGPSRAVTRGASTAPIRAPTLPAAKASPISPGVIPSWVEA